MQSGGGTLRKRRKRNIIKVKGLGAVPYDEAFDRFDYDSRSHSSASKENPYMEKRIPFFKNMHNDSRTSSSSSTRRITRDPLFHMEQGEADIGIGIDYCDKDLFLLSVNGEEPVEKRLSLSQIKDTQEKCPTLLNKATMNRLRLIVSLGMLSGALPWYWSVKNHRIQQYSPTMMKVWWTQWTLITFQTICLGVFQSRMFFNSLSGEITSYRGVFVGSLTVYWYFFALWYRFIVYSGHDRMRTYINTVLSFNADYVEKYLFHLDGYQQGGMIIMNLSIPATCCQIGTNLALYLRFHDQPWYLISYVQPKPWFWLLPGATHDMILVGSDITIYMLMGWLVVAHTHSVNFWLQAGSNINATDYTSDELRQPNRAIETFRSLSILNASFNECMASHAIPALKLTVWLGLIICGYVLVRSMNHVFIDEFPSIMLYPVGIINCAATGYGFISMSAQMSDLGVGFVDSWSRTKHQNFRRVLMSCGTLKIKVGRWYFITVSTIVTFFRIVTDQIINCIITFP